ncbi:hypothetical protein L9F63_014227 [Diploptera punctata]|uniref:U4/U6.U5 small nuclear ribonucleoprotein 27 kDa protein n=1 Tax=Diploptera punctata TaxID=6984 RepID=A0AAD8A899_DIPPU|nr:hypothetical protein L9F63_014227 [Diploptera punctata]
MGYSRSPSPSRRRRSKSRERDPKDRERDRDRDRRRRRSGDRSRRRRTPDREHRHRRSRSWSNSRSRSNSRGRDRGSKSRGHLGERPPVTDADLEGKSPDEQEMMKVMGFCEFDTTKGKRIKGNEEGTVHVILKRKYRQYMNRKGGFNRPLDFVA